MTVQEAINELEFMAINLTGLLMEGKSPELTRRKIDAINLAQAALSKMETDNAHPET